MCIIDPMHNLLLGTGKDEIQSKVDSFNVPNDAGTKISSGFSGFKAEQWRNWTLLFHYIVLKISLTLSTL